MNSMLKSPASVRGRNGGGARQDGSEFATRPASEPVHGKTAKSSPFRPPGR